MDLGGYYIGSDLNRTYYISHYGIKGQKWGVRRFQNADGTWTSAGKERYGSGESLNNWDKRAEKHAAAIKNSKTRIGKYAHNELAYINKNVGNHINDFKSSKTLGGKIGALAGFGSRASTHDAASDFYKRQGEYRTTKLGKHLSNVHEFNAQHRGQANEKVYQAKGVSKKVDKAISGALSTRVKTIAGRERSTGAEWLSRNMPGGVLVSTIMDVGYLVNKKK